MLGVSKVCAMKAGVKSGGKSRRAELWQKIVNKQILKRGGDIALCRD